ncbi:NADPH:quinone reductase [Mycobacterium sp. DL99]|uniref:NADPH:quinone reductase n=1 Tax=Mycobacterium sp. DL99 TaxID=2528957 RepID=UPI001081CC17|nr:NADPH:quinone reductase [Mycobacterium sp. DL99]
MRAVIYRRTGNADEVLELVERDLPEIRPGQVLVRVAVSGVNPTDCRSRSGESSDMKFAEQVPNQDGSGVVTAVADGVTNVRVGQRVWLWEVAFDRPAGTAQEYVAVPARHVVALPDGVSLDVGACLGIPALTAHRALTSAERGPHELAPGALTGASVLVHGGAGAVGHAAIQLAAWAGATVIATVSGPQKALLARNAGADHVIDYRAGDVVAEVLAISPGGVSHIVEVDLAANLDTDVNVIAPHGNINVYSYRPGDVVPLPSPAILRKNAQIGFTYTYGTDPEYKNAALRDVNAAVAAGAMGVGAEHGLPIHRYDLGHTADAHAAVEQGLVGKALIDVCVHGRL